MTSYHVSVPECGGCGAAVAPDQKICEFCGNPIIITSFNSVYDMNPLIVNNYVKTYRKVLSENPKSSEINSAMGICYLKLKLYDKALQSFEKAIESNFDNSETYFYAAICLLKGKKAFLAVRNDIDKIESYIQAAISIESRGIYYYFWAYIKYDYFKRKFFATSPTFDEAMNLAYYNNLTASDRLQLFSILGVERPNCM